MLKVCLYQMSAHEGKLMWVCLCTRGQSCRISPEQINQEQSRQQHEPGGGVAERPKFTSLLGQDF